MIHRTNFIMKIFFNVGMFIWFDLKKSGITDTNNLIKEKAVSAKVLMVPGAAFSTETNAPSSFVRASYSTATLEEMEEAMKRFGELLKNHKTT